MNEQRLQELEDGQMEKLDKLFDQVESKVNSGGTLSPLDFYPEVASFVKGKTYTNWLMHQRPITTPIL